MKILLRSFLFLGFIFGLSSIANADFKGPSSYQVSYIAPQVLDVAAALGVSASSDTYVTPMTVPAVCISTGIGFNAGVANGNMDVGIYDSTGQLLASTGSRAMPGTGFRALGWSTPVTLTPGIYYAALSVSNTTATFARSNTTAAFGYYRYTNSFPLPSSLTIPATVGTRSFWLVILCQGGVNQ